jgi:hypothetical protein
VQLWSISRLEPEAGVRDARCLLVKPPAAVHDVENSAAGSRPMFFSKAYSAVFDIQEDMARAVRQMQGEFGWSDADFTLVMAFSTTYALSLVHGQLKPQDGAKLYFRLDQLVAKHAPAGRLSAAQMADLRMCAATAIAEASNAESVATSYWEAAQEYAGMMFRDELIRVLSKICGTIQAALQRRGLR